ncbi:MAG TPA: HesA/MoeB/ThiF family protein [Bacteroidia bacterium]|nr:HesA/MoeB/ThiF family protein [Bacteroidia bacterium]
MMLNKEEIKLYDRHIKLNEIGLEGQLKLKSAKVLVVGAGGLGCPVLQYLTATGVGTIGIVDFDVVEISNLQRQVLYTFNDIGKNKAEQASDHLKLKNPFVHFDCFTEKITVGNTLKIFSDYDIIIDCTDNFETRYLINDACVLTNKTLVFGSVEKFAGQVTVFNFPVEKMQRTGTYRCLFPQPSDVNTIFNCEELGVLGILPGLIGTIQATETIKIITGLGETLAGKLLIIDASTMSFDQIQFSRNEKIWKNFPQTREELENFNYHAFCSSSTANSKIKTISPENLNINIKNNKPMQILDVRNPNELPALLSNNLLQIPVDEIRNRQTEIRKDIPVIVVCTSGQRSKNVIEILQKDYGLDNLFNLAGGISEWNSKSGILK